MECPKCGHSLAISIREDIKRFEEQTYQQRLDNVLSKFEKVKDKTFENGHYLKYTIQEYPDEVILTASDTDNLFFIGRYAYGSEISLATVEHLLKDLEEL
jgi:hypothetical protein